MALARLRVGKPSVPGPQEGFRYWTRGLKDMPVAPNEPRNWRLENDYTGVQAFDLFDIGPVLGMDWMLINKTTDDITVLIDSDSTFVVGPRRSAGEENVKFIRIDVAPDDVVNPYSLWITGIKP